MKHKIFNIIIIITFFFLLSIVSADDNVVDVNITNTTSQIEVNKSQTEITAVNIETYTDLETTFTVKLSSNKTPLENKQVKITINNNQYEQQTNSQGQASINFKLKSGTYNAAFSFMGDEKYTQSNGTATITVKSNLITFIKVVDEDINYREGLKSIFQIKLTDINNNAVTSQTITIKVGGKTYSAKTNTKGIATFHINLKKGSYTVEYSFDGNNKYVSSKNTFNINVKSKLTKGYGYWVNKWDMKKVNLKKLSKLGTKHIFLQHTSINQYGKSYVLNWIKKAHKYGIKVHLWMAVFYKNGKFIHPANKNGVYNYKHMDSMINTALNYASLNMDGIHFDYVRYGGNAYKYKNAVNAINYFVKKASLSIHKIKPEMIISAAVMPEPNSMKYYYGQDTQTMSKYLDVIIPMIYKGNYHAKTSWIKKTTKKFLKQSNSAKIWSGIQTYKSDSNIKKLSYKTLFKDAKAAKKGGADGVVLFRWGLTKYINFKKL